MTQFIILSDGSFLNIDDVARVGFDAEGLPILRDAAGAAYGKTASFNPDEYGPVVQAAPDAVAIILTDYGDADVSLSKLSIIAWRISDHARPIFAQTIAANQLALVPQPDGRLVSQSDETVYDDLEAAKASFAHERRVMKPKV